MGLMYLHQQLPCERSSEGGGTVIFSCVKADRTVCQHPGLLLRLLFVLVDLLLHPDNSTFCITRYR